MNLTFTGGEQLAQTLRRLPAAVATNVLSGSLLAGGGIIRDAAAMRAPRPAVRRRARGVRLGDSIRVQVTEQSTAYATAAVFTRIPYAHLVEYGHQIVPRGPSRERVSITTVRISKRTGKEIVSTRFGLDPSAQLQLHSRRGAGPRGFVPAQPFLRPAFDENREAVIQKIGVVMGAGIEAEVKRLSTPNAERATVLAPAGIA